MGTRLHYAVQKADWGGGDFNNDWEGLQKFLDHLDEKETEEGFIVPSEAFEGQDSFELPEGLLKLYVEELLTLPPTEPSRFFDGYTNAEELEIWQNVLENADASYGWIQFSLY